jgi:hypothetical protein
MTTPADDDDIGPKSFGLTQDSVDRCLVDDDGLCIGPLARECTSRAVRRIVGAAIECRQKNRAPVWTARLSRNHRPNACSDGPWSVHNTRNGSAGLRRSVCRNQNAEVG